jgi:putative aminopeptidase FrvX
MNSGKLCAIAGRLMRNPAAPYYEHAVREEVKSICRENRLSFEQDPFGNILIRLENNRSIRPLALAAHMDHPGFEVARVLSDQSCVVRFQGGVPDNYFHPGIAIRLMPGNVPVRLGRAVPKPREFEVRARSPWTTPPQFAVWDLEAFTVRRNQIYGRACDDTVGVACVLATLIELKRSRAPVNVIGIISRAEEVGFRGVLSLVKTKALPKKSLVISLETSRELPGVKMNQGVILRVGDRTSVFDTKAMQYLAEVASGLGTAKKPFPFQRGLMSGGTCEATAFQEYGFQTGAVCVALGNYHNCAPGKKIAAEYVSVGDCCGMVDLLVQAARQMKQFSKLTGKLPAKLEQMRRESEKRLRATAR